MPTIAPAALARELARGLRPDAYRYFRPDWRRDVRAGSDLWALYEDVERKYRPDQPRVPAGSSDGGQWTSDEGGSEDSALPKNARLTGHIPRGRASKLPGGHHYVPRAVFESKKVSDEAKGVFEKAKTGKLYDIRSNQWDEAHREYSKAVKQLLDDYLASNNVEPEKMTGAQAREVLGKVFDSADPRIKSYNLGIHLREIMQRIFRRGGRE